MDTLEARIRAGDAIGVRELLDRDSSAVMAPVQGAPSPLLLAIYYGHREVAEALRRYQPTLSWHEAAALGDEHEIRRHLSLNSKAHTAVSSDGFTALGYAAYFGHRETVRQLLAAGADPNVRSSNPMGVAPLHSALAGGHKEMAMELVQNGADPNLSSAEGWTPLHYTAASGDIETSRFLIERGADRTPLRSDGKTPSVVAMESGHTELADLLAPR